METLIQDLRFGIRMLAKNPGFTLVAVITMALGIGANTALFSVVNGVLLKSLPFKEPDRLLFAFETNAKLPSPTIPASTLDYRDWKEQNQVFESMGARKLFTVSLSGVEQPEKIQGEKVTSDYFSTLGVEPILGRTFAEDEDKPGGTKVTLLSYGLWQRRFGGSMDIVGQTVLLNGAPTTVVGIMPNDYRPNVELWIPLAINYTGADRDLKELIVVGRLMASVSRQQAQAEMTTIAGRLAEQYPDFNTGWGVSLLPMHDAIVQNIRPALLILFGAVGFVLLIACSNVANLLLARAAAREREIAIRMAMGAGRLRLIRQILTESVLVSLIGGALGVLIAMWGTQALISLNPQGIPRANEIGVDPKVLVFALVASVVSGVIFGLVPAVQTSRQNLNDVLKEAGKSLMGNARGRRIRSGLVVVEVALALVLMTGAGLLIKGFSKLQSVDPGFNHQSILTFQLSLPEANYPKHQQQTAFLKDVLDRFSALPGVTSAAAISQAPLAGGGPSYIFWAEGRPLPTPSEAPIASYRVISPDYFHTLNIPLVAGRGFTEADNIDAPQVTIVNENFAKNMWPGENPIGKRMTVGVPLAAEKVEWYTVVGVVGNVKHTALNGESGMQMYQPVLQADFQSPARTMTYLLRTTVNAVSLTETAHSVVASIDSNVPMSNVKTMDRIVYDSVSPFRFNMFLLVLFAGVALVLTIVGVYGVMNYAVTQRTREIGIRMALGADPGQVRSLILRQGMALSAIGLGIGLVACFGVTRLLSSLLYGVSATDPVTFAAVALLLAVVALVACYVPARRATKVDPLVALRYE
jgi:putative ABC transport system permease protein